MTTLIFKLVLILALTIHSTNTDLTLSTGTIIRNNGLLHLVDRYLGLILDFKHFNQFNDQFVNLREQLNLVKNAINHTACTLISPDLNYNIIRDLTEELNNVITPIHLRQKRAWPALIVGGISALFSLSTQVQLIYLQNQMSNVIKTQENIRIEQIQTKERLEETHKLINLLQSDVESLRDILSDLSNNMELCFQHNQITSLLINIKLDLEKTLRELRSYINSIIAVSNGQVTADILPLETLNKILHNDTYAYNTNAIFPKNSTHLYYPFLEAQLTPKGLLITVPLNSVRTYNYYTFVPYPTCSDNETLILESETTELLVDVKTHSHFEEFSKTLDKCSTHLGLTLCNNIYLNIVENTKDTCLYSLLNSAESSPSCRFKSPTSRDSPRDGLPAFLRIDDYTLIFNPLREDLRILCPGNISTSSACTTIIPISCGLRSSGKSLNPVSIIKIKSTKPTMRKVIVPFQQIKKEKEEKSTILIFIATLVSLVIIGNAILVLIICKRMKSRITLPKIIHKAAN